MDDTVVLATTREAMQQKLMLLHREAESICMEIHPQKSKYMVINSNDDRSFNLQHITIDRTNEDVYLDTPIINASLAKQVKAHIDFKRSHLIKFSSFLNRNTLPSQGISVQKRAQQCRIIRLRKLALQQYKTSHLTDTVSAKATIISKEPDVQ